MTEQPSPSPAPGDPDAKASDEARKPSDLVPRVITAVVGIPILIGVVWAAPPWVFAVVGALAVVIGAWEYVSMTMGTDRRVAQVVTCASTLGVYAAMILTNMFDLGADGALVEAAAGGGPSGDVLLCALAAAVVAQFLVHLFTYREIEEVTLHIGSGLVAMLYAGMMPGFLVLLHQDAGAAGGIWIVLTMATVWGSDSGAYFVGRAIGKHKLAPRVSPKKSIEGAVGGLVSSIIAVFIFKYAGLLPELTIVQVLVLAIPANLLAQTGDLCESIVKRAHGVKDSGVIIYGHGGLLDRIDALLFAAPWFYFVHRFLI